MQEKENNKMKMKNAVVVFFYAILAKKSCWPKNTKVRRLPASSGMATGERLSLARRQRWRWLEK